jgi:proteasome activator subunit 4
VLTHLEGLNSFFEACYLVYDIENPAVNEAVQNLQASISTASQDGVLLLRCQNERIERIRLVKKAAELTVGDLSSTT